MVDPCNATHQHENGVQCEGEAGHRGMHRTGAANGRALFWSSPYDLATREALVAELTLLNTHLRAPDGSSYILPMDESIDRAWKGRSGTEADLRDCLRARAALLVNTLYGDLAAAATPRV